MSYPAKFFPLQAIFRFLYFLFLYLVLPPALFFNLKGHRLLPLSVFYLLNILLALYLFRKSSNSRYRVEYESSDLQEKLNLSAEEKSRQIKNSDALKVKIIRYHSLEKVVQELNESLDLDTVANHLTSIAFSAISNNRGACLLYLVDTSTQKLRLFKAKKEDKKLVIKVKEGNIFDSWVLRHGNPLLIEDLKKDFRFDRERLEDEEDRSISSLISSPLNSDGNILGILRLTHPEPNFFNQDDLRFLATVCDLGTVALENSQLFQKTQDLAIHDGLTSLYTKGYLLESLEDECRRALRHDSVFSLLMLDIDFFKNYNDKFGHSAGDIVLKRLSQDMTDSLREFNALISRFGGEEFCVILRGIKKNNALKIAEELRKKIEKERIVLRRIETAVTVSIGVASFPVDAKEHGELIAKSDKAMYEAKQKGRNRVCSS